MRNGNDLCEGDKTDRYINSDEALLNYLCSYDLRGYRKRVEVLVNGYSATALLDSGNLFYSVCSLSFLKTLGKTEADLVPLPGQSHITTAGENQKLTILGRLKHSLKLQLGQHPTITKFRPVVIQNLSMSLNLSGPLLKTHKIDQIHSKDSLLFQGRFIPLLDEVQKEKKIEKVNCNL